LTVCAESLAFRSENLPKVTTTGAKMAVGITTFSRFIGELREASDEHDTLSLIDWGVARLLDDLDVDAAWCGWAEIKPSEVAVYSSSASNLPDDYTAFWETMNTQDLLARAIVGNPSRVATYARNDLVQTDGMVALADRYHLNRMATAMEIRPRGRTAFFLSVYRGGRHPHEWASDETEYLSCGVEHLAAAARTRHRGPLESALGSKGVELLADGTGRAFIGGSALSTAFSDLWPGDGEDELPDVLRAAAAVPGRTVIEDMGLVVEVKPLNGHRFRGLTNLSVRRANPLDVLTLREIEIAGKLARGKSHKLIARDLGISPATARNHIQSIYRKTGVDNRVALARLVMDASA
jgi:DNA-binding CsgD family transcriptional regulator